MIDNPTMTVHVGPFFCSTERIDALEAESRRWIGTPWCPNSDAIGTSGGVSCHNLPRAIYIAIGALPRAFPKVIGTPVGTKHSRQSVMEPWLDQQPEFTRVPNHAEIQPGDLVGLRIFACCDHLAIALRDTRIVHVLMRKHTAIDQIGSWTNRIMAVWRPMEISV